MYVLGGGLGNIDLYGFRLGDWDVSYGNRCRFWRTKRILWGEDGGVVEGLGFCSYVEVGGLFRGKRKIRVWEGCGVKKKFRISDV